MELTYYLEILGLGQGAYVLPTDTAKKLVDASDEFATDLAVDVPESANKYFYALFEEHDNATFSLHYGYPGDGPDYPLLDEFIESRGYELDEESLKKYLVEERGEDPEDLEAFALAFKQLEKELGEVIGGGEREHWMAWDFETHHSTLASAYRYLEDLPLGNAKVPQGGISVGKVVFIEGDRPGSNLTFVEIHGIQAVRALQYRLLELGEKIHIHPGGAL